MIDKLGRNIRYLRLSLTERCQLRCEYCRADSGECPKQSELSTEEVLRIVRVVASLGIDKIRLTGGEPLLRTDIVEIVRGIAHIPSITEINLTTNALRLPELAGPLKEAGLTRVNISIDSLDPDKFRAMTGGGNLETVLAGIREAVRVSLAPVKLNAVVMRGKNDDEIGDFIELTKDQPIDMRFIELMPMGEHAQDDSRVPTDEILARFPQLQPMAPRYPGQPSSDYQVPGYLGRVGFISPISHKFCGDCNRIRITSDGMLRPCLGNNAEVSLKDALKAGDDTELYNTIFEAIRLKPTGHCFDETFLTSRNMSKIGG
ncbi:MAG: GTP 3',8-cyclase MoaA [Clostridia bacterium]|nr:GTP 3',8-cyclase MoaA [Clostridia bacterium]